MTVAPIAPTTDPEPIGRRCKARSPRTGQPCKAWAIRGADVCRSHGGAAPQVRRAAEARIIEQRVTQLFGQNYDDRPVTNPLEAFATLTGKVLGWMRILERLVEKLDSPGYQAMTGEQIKAEVQLFERALDRCNTVLATHARLNIDARLAAITEQQGRIVLAAIQAALASAGVSGARAIEAGRVAAAKMRVLEAEAAAVNVEDDRERP